MAIKQTISRSVIIPAILATEGSYFLKELEFATSVGAVHLDVCDSEFVKTLTLPIDKWPERIEAKYSEAHLMVKDPINYLEELAKHNITRAIIHIESRFDITELRNKARELDILLGYAINPETNLALLKPYFETNAYFQVMGVTPGNSNQAQIDQTPLAVAFLRKSTLQHIIISVDGGVSEQNVDRLRRSGADYLVSTHAIFTTGDWQENYNKLTSLSEDSNK